MRQRKYLAPEQLPLKQLKGASKYGLTPVCIEKEGMEYKIYFEARVPKSWPAMTINVPQGFEYKELIDSIFNRICKYFDKLPLDFQEYGKYTLYIEGVVLAEFPMTSEEKFQQHIAETEIEEARRIIKIMELYSKKGRK